MQAISYHTAQSQLADTMDRVCEDHEPVMIIGESEQAVVMVSLEDYNALAETAYLLRSPANARRMLDAVTELEQGGGDERALAERRSSSPSRPGKIISTGRNRTARCSNASTNSYAIASANPSPASKPSH